MDPRITIRNTESAEDVEAVRTLLRAYAAHLNAHLGEQHICLENYERELALLPRRYAPPEGQLLLARVDGQPAGCVALRRLPAKELLPPDSSGCELKRLFVLPQYRGLRLGRELTDTLLRFARERGYDAMYLDTVPSMMPQAMALYAAFGFLPVTAYNTNQTTNVRHFRLGLQPQRDAGTRASA